MTEPTYQPGLSELDYYDILNLAYEAKARALEPAPRGDAGAPAERQPAPAKS